MKRFRLFALATTFVLASILLSNQTQAQLLPSFKKSNQEAPRQTAVQQASPQAETAVEMPELVAEVNGDKIMKSELAEECLRLHGKSELADQVKKFLIQLECRQKGITVTQKEINDEIARMAKTFNFSTEEWLNLLQNERNITPEQYMQDIIWPILAIGKLAGAQLQISEEEIQQEFNSQFGPAVQVRQIVLKSRPDAERVLQEVKENPESFASVAKNRSMDSASQPYGGLIHPIRPGTLKNADIEKILFNLKPGEVSPIVEYPVGVFIVFRCEQHLQPQNVDMVRVRERLEMKIRDNKTRIVSEKVFVDLQEQAQIDIVFGNPAKMQQLPGIAAIVNGQNISMKFLSDVCVKRYGMAILSDMISKLIIEQACRKNNIVITDADIDTEIREMAIRHVPLKDDGSPNISLWMKLATENSQVPIDIYRRNTVWPVLALKRLSRSLVQVTEDDLQRSFEANYGKKIRCLAITFHQNDQRRALEVWQMANQRKTAEYFSELAETYSVDNESRLAKGVIPSIGRHCGQPALEKEAFGLLPNEISQLIQVDNHWVILYCLGHEEATISDRKEVETDLAADIFDKKQRIAVERYYENLFNQTAFDNYLTGETRNPQIEKAIRDNESGPSQATGAAASTR